MPSELPVFPQVETRFGRMFTLRGDTVISRSLRIYGEFAGEEVDSILSLVRPGDHVLDLGANIGFHSLALARAVGPGGRVTSVEPQRLCFQLLSANVTQNQLPWVHCLRAAAGEAAGTCSVPVIDPAAQQNVGATAVTLDPGDGPSETVPVITVDSLGLSRCDLIKIDTEGFEDRIVLGARATLAAHRPALYVELHDRDKLHRIATALRPLDYSLALHQTRFHRTENPQGERLQAFDARAGGTALVAMPPGRSLPEGLPGKLQTLRWRQSDSLSS